MSLVAAVANLPNYGIPSSLMVNLWKSGMFTLLLSLNFNFLTKLQNAEASFVEND